MIIYRCIQQTRRIRTMTSIHYDEITTLAKYIDSCIKFWKDTKDWERLQPLSHYSATPDGDWEETYDNPRGGIPVEWAAGCKGYSRRPTEEEVRRNAIHHYAEYFQLLSEEIKASEE
jgi:hypothetical protein